MTATEQTATQNRTWPILSVRDLCVSFTKPTGSVTPVDGVSFDLSPGEVLGIAGESGSGKSLTLKSVLGLLARGGSYTGELKFSADGSEPVAYDPVAIRGHGISMIFQEPMTALNPTMRVGDLIGLGARLHHGRSKKDALADAIQLMREVGIPAPERRARAWPHELSGGLRQRVMIATALSTQPKLLLCDEPTTALDVTVQRQILNLLRDLVAERSMSMIFVTHDLPVLGQLSDRIAVMYAGRLVEVNDAKTLFRSPHHPYTHALMHSAPVIDVTEHRLEGIDGRPPDPNAFPRGCRFADRCPYVVAEECEAAPYELAPTTDGAQSACVRQVELEGVR